MNINMNPNMGQYLLTLIKHYHDIAMDRQRTEMTEPFEHEVVHHQFEYETRLLNQIEESVNHFNFIFEVLRIMAQIDSHSSLYWNVESDGKIKPLMMCSDLFAWGCADCEEITPENLLVLKQTILDLENIEKGLAMMEATELFCARVRKMRPQGAAYTTDVRVIPLFDACSPEREIGFGNPAAQPKIQIQSK